MMSPLRIETGRYQCPAVDAGIYKFRKLEEIDDKFHFVFKINTLSPNGFQKYQRPNPVSLLLL